MLHFFNNIIITTTTTQHTTRRSAEPLSPPSHTIKRTVILNPLLYTNELILYFAKEVIEHFANKENRFTVPTECGFKEILTIKPFGELISKFDTGNSGMPVIHADKFQVEKNNTIRWSLLGKTITSKIVRTEEISVGGLRDYEEERHTVKLDVEFAGTLYKNVEFTLDDRKDRTKNHYSRAVI